MSSKLERQRASRGVVVIEDPNSPSRTHVLLIHKGGWDVDNFVVSCRGFEIAVFPPKLRDESLPSPRFSVAFLSDTQRLREFCVSVIAGDKIPNIATADPDQEWTSENAKAQMEELMRRYREHTSNPEGRRASFLARVI